MILDNDYADLDMIRNIVIFIFNSLGNNDLLPIKPFESAELYNSQLNSYNEISAQGLKKIMKDISIIKEDFKLIDRDEKGIKTLEYTPCICVEIYTINVETNEIANGILDYQEEITYSIMFHRNDLQVDENICPHCNAKKLNSSSKCEYCGLMNNKWIIDSIKETKRRDFHKDYVEERRKYNQEEWNKLYKDLDNPRRTNAFGDRIGGFSGRWHRPRYRQYVSWWRHWRRS